MPAQRQFNGTRDQRVTAARAAAGLTWLTLPWLGWPAGALAPAAMLVALARVLLERHWCRPPVATAHGH